MRLCLGGYGQRVVELDKDVVESRILWRLFLGCWILVVYDLLVVDEVVEKFKRKQGFSIFGGVYFFVGVVYIRLVFIMEVFWVFI